MCVACHRGATIFPDNTCAACGNFVDPAVPIPLTDVLDKQGLPAPGMDFANLDALLESVPSEGGEP